MIWIAAAAAAVLLFAIQAEAGNAPLAPGADGIQEMIRRTALRHGIKPAVMLAICQQESSFLPSAVNPSDPSYGLFQIMTPWLKHFGYTADTSTLMDAQFNTTLACQIVRYFQERGFTFPDQADIYNVGETLWNKGRRNLYYRDRVKDFFRMFNV